MQVNHSQSVRGTNDVNSAPAGKPSLKDRLTSLASSLFTKRQPIELSSPKAKPTGATGVLNDNLQGGKTLNSARAGEAMAKMSEEPMPKVRFAPGTKES